MSEIGPIDQRTREQVLDPAQSFIVQAPAGSGKTELLVRRYLRLLAVVDKPEEILAITFTRKAAAEMRERIIDALKDAKQAPDSAASALDANRQARLEVARQALARDTEQGWQLTRNPARMKLQTVDAFYAALTAQMPLLSKLGGQPALAENPDRLYQEAAANVLKWLEEKHAAQDPDRGAAARTLLAHLDNDLPRVRNLLTTMLGRRDQWLRRLAGAALERDRLEEALRRVIEATLEETLSLLTQQFMRATPDPDEDDPDTAEQKFIECLRHANAKLSQLEQLPGCRAEDLQQWQQIVDLCLTKAGKCCKSVTERHGALRESGNKHLKYQFLQTLNAFSLHPRLPDLFREIRALPPAGFGDNEWRALEALGEMLILAAAELRVLFAQHNQLDFIGVSMAARQALGDEDEPTDLALYLDYRIHHILLDEYQDTSVSQHELLQRLTAGWSAEDGHSLFLVGDPMQSIYRFREAEIGVFLNTWQSQRLGNMPVQPANIEVNFRSDKALVDWVNSTFAGVFPAQSMPVRGAVSYAPAVAFHDYHTEPGLCVHPFNADHTSEQDGRLSLDKHAVHLHPMLGDRDNELEAQRVIDIISTTHKQTQQDTIAILVSSRAHLQAVAAALTREGIRFRAPDIETLQSRPLIQDLLALTRALHHPADRVAWLALLRAPWCGLMLADLLHLAGDAKSDTIWHCLQDQQRRATLSADGQQRLARVCAALEQTLARQARMPLRRWVESAWLNLGGPATLTSDTDLRDANAFFELLETYERGGDLSDREEFLEQVGRLYASPDLQADDSLQLMTIHSAKGLEFDHVILPGLSGGRGSNEKSLLLWTESPYQSEHEAEQLDVDLLVAPIKESAEDSSPIYDLIARLQADKENHEAGRVLYVAVTRARRRVHLLAHARINQSGSLGKPNKSSLLAHLWSALKEHFEACLEQQSTMSAPLPTTSDNQVQTLRRLRADWQLPSAPSATQWDATPLPESEDERIEFQWAGRAIRHTGTVVHRYLQLIATQGMSHWNAGKIAAARPVWRAALYELGTPETELDTACDYVEQALNATLDDPRGQWLLTGHQEQASEYGLSGQYQGGLVNIVIDRTFIDEHGTRWIIDYKTSRHESGDLQTFLDQQQERYRGQLEKYAALMSMMDERPIRLGLYFPLLRGWREWPYESDVIS